MFAHHTIASLSTLLEQFNKAKDTEVARRTKRHIRHLLSEIPSAQKFHLGDYSKLVGSVQKKKGMPLFSGELGDYAKLPFPKVWFDWTFGGIPESPESKSNKRGAYVIQGGNGLLHISMVSYCDFYKQWVPSHMTYLAMVGTDRSLLECHADNNSFRVDIGGEYHIGHCVPDRNIMLCPVIDLGFDKNLKALSEDVRDLEAINIGLMLLNCRNITPETIKAPEKVNKKRIRNGKLPIFDYKVLMLDLCKDGPESRNGKHQGGENRVHLCRGHFKTYSKDRPLFGRISGLWWWQPHVRGRNHNGVVMKDYQVKTSGAA